MSDIFFMDYTVWTLPQTKHYQVKYTCCHPFHVEVTGVNITFKSAKEVKFRLPKSNENFTCTVLKESANTSRVSNTAVTNVKIVPLTPNTTYSIRCIGIEDQCVEVDQMFTTATIKGKDSYSINTGVVQTF